MTYRAVGSITVGRAVSSEQIAARTGPAGRGVRFLDGRRPPACGPRRGERTAIAGAASGAALDVPVGGAAACGRAGKVPPVGGGPRARGGEPRRTARARRRGRSAEGRGGAR